VKAEGPRNSLDSTANRENIEAGAQSAEPDPLFEMRRPKKLQEPAKPESVDVTPYSGIFCK